MSQSALSCPKCSGEMIQGTVVNLWGRVSVPGSRWIEGITEISFLGGAQLPRGKRPIPIGTFRCQSCGYLEAYARPEFAVK